MDEPPVQTLSHDRLIERIGEGGMGVVWKAQGTILEALPRKPAERLAAEPDLAAFNAAAR